MRKKLLKLSGAISIKIFYSFISITLVFIVYISLWSFAGYLLGVDLNNNWTSKTWIRLGITSSFIFIFPALSCIWSGTIEFIKTNKPPLTISKRVKIWFISTGIGFVVYIVAQLIGSLILEYNILVGGVLGHVSSLIGWAVAQRQLSKRLKFQ